MNISTIVKPSSIKQKSQPRAGVNYRLLAINSGGEEFLLRPEYIRGVYQLGLASLSSDLSNVLTPEGTIPSVSLAERLSNDFGFKPQNAGNERTVIVFRDQERSVALRVHSVSRPMDVDARQVFPLPAMAHPVGQESFLDSLALVSGKATNHFDRIAIVINPMVALGFWDKAAPLSAATLPESESVNNARDQHTGSPTTRQHLISRLPRDCGNAQVVAFVARTPLPSNVNFRFCLPMSAIAEVLLDQPISSLPSASSILSGYLLWRSRPVPVIDLAKAFGASEASDSFPTASKGRMLVVKVPGGNYVAIQTDMNIQTLKSPNVSRVDYPPIDGHPHLGAYPDTSGLLVLPDLSAILSVS